MGKKIQCIGRYAMDGVTLGKGNFAHVELATHGVTEVKVAIKIIDTRKIKDEYVRTNLHREARIMSSLRHPNIIRLYETLKATTLYCLVTEFAGGGELLAFIKEQKDCLLGENTSRPFIRQLVSAICYLHERHIVHRDLKMENIMLDEKKKNIKLIDFGLSNLFKEDDPLKTHCGSPEYAAPELFVIGKTYGPEVDIWSLGIIMYAMILGRLPFCTPFRDEYHRQRMLQQIQKGLSPVHDREMHVLSADCRNLLHQLIEPNPELRIPMIEMQSHAWITKNGKCPFFDYAPPPRNKNLRNETVSELAVLMDMKKGIVNETVKDNRADELSAMFNMMMDNKKKQFGFMDIDHTKKAWQERNARSRSGEREKSVTPDHKTKSKVCLVTRKIPTGKKSGIGSKVKPKNRPAGAAAAAGAGGGGGGGGTSNDVMTASVHLNVDVDVLSSSRIPSPSGGATPHLPPSTPHRDAPHKTHLRNHSQMMVAPSSSSHADSSSLVKNATPAIDLSKIPLSQRRVPPPKLSLTLDLSVTNPGVATHKVVHHRDDHNAIVSNPNPANADKKDSAVTDCSFGIAASSGVPPRLSPKDGNKDSSRIPVPSGSGKSLSRPKVVSIVTTTRARRPSSLQYSQKITRLSIPRQSLTFGIIQKQPQLVAAAPESPSSRLAPPPSAPPLVAPKAVPEDSLIDSCSTEDSENRFLGSLLEAIELTTEETMQLDLLNGLDFDDVGGLRNIELCRDEAEMLRLHHYQAATAASASASLSLTASVIRPVSLSFTSFCLLNKDASNSAAKQKRDDDDDDEEEDEEDEEEEDEENSSKIPSQVDREKINNCHHQVVSLSKTLLLRHEEDEKRCLAGSGISLPATFHKLQSTNRKRNREESSLKSRSLVNSLSSHICSLPASQPSGTSTLYDTSTLSETGTLSDTGTLLAVSDNDSLGLKSLKRGSIDVRSRRKFVTDPSSKTFLSGSGLSPGSPSYDDRHSKFSHIGSHALDVFFSPEETTPTGLLWRPVVTKVQTSPTQQDQSNGDPLRLCTTTSSAPQSDIVSKTTNLMPPSVVIAPLITSLDIFDDDDDNPSKCRPFYQTPLTFDGRSSKVIMTSEGHMSNVRMTLKDDCSASIVAGLNSETNCSSFEELKGIGTYKREEGDWLRLAGTSVLLEADSNTSTTWSHTGSVASRQFPLSSESSSISQDSLEMRKANGRNGEKTKTSCHADTATCDKDSTTADIKDSLQIRSSSSNETKKMFESRIPRPSSLRHKIPVLGSFLISRDRRGSTTKATSSQQRPINPTDSQPIAVMKEDKRVLKSSSEVKALKMSSWRHGLSHWLQLSRSSTANSNNNVASQKQSSSAPMSISLISNHGCKSSLTIPNNYSKIHNKILDITRDNRFMGLDNNSQTLLTNQPNSDPVSPTSKGRSLHTLLEVVDTIASVQSRSPLARLRVRKVQWEECQKCAQSDHSSDESASDTTCQSTAANVKLIDSITTSDDTLQAPVTCNNMTQNWT